MKELCSIGMREVYNRKLTEPLGKFRRSEASDLIGRLFVQLSNMDHSFLITGGYSTQPAYTTTTLQQK